jgi:hypothetical protein
MRGPTRLAGAGPLDGRVRRRSMHSLGLHCGELGAACKSSHLSSERQRAPRMRASQRARASNEAMRQRAWTGERARTQAVRSCGCKRSEIACAGAALNLIGFRVSEPCAGRQRTDSRHEPLVFAKRKAPTTVVRVRNTHGRSRHSTLAPPNV